MQSLDESGGFQDSAVDTNFSACERSMKQVVLAFRHLGKAWKVRRSITFDHKKNLFA